ncbi:MAG: polysaccharide biosynthesis tyrosine autokinase [Sedimentisphaerales bacterium]|nr:polysaccharide biosynthesis tyrosine autokinase [Sedimentisphaerales bacterium]
MARPAPQSSTSTLTPKDIMGMLKRRMWLIIIITFVAIIAAGGLWYFCYKNYPKYTSTGIISCKMPVHQDVFTRNPLIPQAQIIEQETQNKAIFLRSDYFLEKILERTDVMNTRWYASFGRDNAERLNALRDSFGAAPQRNSEYIVVSMSTHNAAESRTILNAALTAFEQEMDQQANDPLDSRLAALTERKRQLELDLRNQRTRLSSLAQSADVPGWERGQNVVTQELNALHQEQLRLNYQLQELRLAQELLAGEINSGGISSNVQMAVEQDREVAGFRNRIAGLSEEMDRLLSRFGEDHREVEEIRSRIESNQQSLEARQAELIEQYSGAEQLGLEQQIRTVASQLARINEEFRQVSARQSNLDQRLTEYNQIQDEARQIQNRLAAFDEQIASTQTLLASRRERVFAEVAAPASLPLEMSFPKLSMFLPGGFILGLLISIGLAFLLEFIDDSVKMPLDIHRHLRIPNLGMVPLYEEEDIDEVCLAKIIEERPNSVMSEFCRQLTSNVAFSAPADELKTMLVTSCSGDCGKTTVALNLALALAGDGERVCVVDANFRRPRINTLSQKSSTSGLSDLLVGRAQLDEVIYQTEYSGLDFVASGPIPPNPANLLGGKTMQAFIKQLRDRYDRIIIDGPPALVVSDARLIAGKVDGTIVVIRAGTTGRGVVLRLIRELRQNNARVMGAVLNAVKPRRGGYLRETYENYYDYVGAGKSQKAPPAKPKN